MKKIPPKQAKDKRDAIDAQVALISRQ